MPDRNMFPEEQETVKTNDTTGSTPSKSLLETIFGIGGINLPEGNKVAIWMLVVIVIVFIIFFYFFMNIMDKVVDKALNPRQVESEVVLQEDYNKLLKDAKVLQAENIWLKDSLSKQPDELRQRTDSAIYQETNPHIQQLYNKNKKKP